MEGMHSIESLRNLLKKPELGGIIDKSFVNDSNYTNWQDFLQNHCFRTHFIYLVNNESQNKYKKMWCQSLYLLEHLCSDLQRFLPEIEKIIIVIKNDLKEPMDDEKLANEIDHAESLTLGTFIDGFVDIKVESKNW